MATVTRVLYELVGVDKLSGTLDKAGRSAGVAESRISKLGRTIAHTGLLISGAAAAIGAESVKAAVDFQSSMEKIHTQAGASQKDVKALSAEVLKLGMTTQQGPEQLSEALYHL